MKIKPAVTQERLRKRFTKGLWVDFHEVNPEIIVNIDFYFVLEGIGRYFKFAFF